MAGRVGFALRVVAACLLAGAASAQHPGLLAPEPRPLHVQLAEADAVAIATVAAVGRGRIQLVDGRGVLGSPPAAFELKRAPSAAPPLVEGDLALLLLRGARTPYLLASSSLELIRLADAAQAPAWSSGVRELREAGTSGAAIARAYAAWLDAASPGMQRESAIGLAHRDCPVAALHALASRLADRAISGADSELRRWSARAAARTPSGRRRLLERLPSEDPAVLVSVLGATPTAELETAAGTLLRSLRHESPENRAAALRFVRRFPDDREIRAQLVRISSEDPDERLREQARRVMKSRASR